MADAARLVASHLISLVGDAGRHGIDLETISKELAVHSASVALAYLPPSDLHAIVDLIELQAAVLIAPAIVRLFGDVELPADLDDGLPPAQGDLGLPQLRDDLFDGVFDAWHLALLWAQD